MTRLYKYDSGQISRVALPDGTLSSLTENVRDSEWSTMVNPAASAVDRDVQAASLFSLPTDGNARCPARSVVLLPMTFAWCEAALPQEQFCKATLILALYDAALGDCRCSAGSAASVQSPYARPRVDCEWLRQLPQMVLLPRC